MLPHSSIPEEALAKGACFHQTVSPKPCSPPTSDGITSSSPWGKPFSHLTSHSDCSFPPATSDTAALTVAVCRTAAASPAPLEARQKQQLPQKSRTRKESPLIFIAFDAMQYPKIKSLLSTDCCSTGCTGWILLTCVFESWWNKVQAQQCLRSTAPTHYNEYLKTFKVTSLSREHEKGPLWYFMSCFSTFIHILSKPGRDWTKIIVSKNLYSELFSFLFDKLLYLQNTLPCPAGFHSAQQLMEVPHQLRWCEGCSPHQAAVLAPLHPSLIYLK